MKNALLALLFFSTYSSANQVIDDNCKSPISGTGVAIMDEMQEKMNIDIKRINEKDITTELLFNEPVSEVLSGYYAKENHNQEKYLTLEKYKEIYSGYNPRNLIIKFIFKNNEGKENIFLVSTIANDYECNVRFNGYVIVKREF